MAEDMDGDDESIVSLPAWEEQEYNELMAKLRSNENGLVITIYREVLDFILNERKIDDFCSALRLASSLNDLDIGHGYAWLLDETPLPTLEITPENSEALNKLYEAVRFVGNRLEWLHLRFIDEISSDILCSFLASASHESLTMALFK